VGRHLNIGVRWKNVKERAQLEDLVVDGRIILNEPSRNRMGHVD
jgi:hypothetical protein